MRARSSADKARLATELRTHLWPALADGRLAPIIFKTFPMVEAPAAHRLMESSDHIGKIMLQVR